MFARLLLVVAAMVLPFMSIVPNWALASSRAHVYFLSGFMGISPGLDELADKIRRRGVPVTVAGYSDWSSLAGSAIESYKSGRLGSIVIVGHSMGGGAALDMAAELGQSNVPVQLVVTLDPTGTTAVSTNVRRVVNYYVRNGMGSRVSRSSRSGVVRNSAERNPDVGHFSIITAHERQAITDIMSAVSNGAAAPEAATTPQTTRGAETPASTNAPDSAATAASPKPSITGARVVANPGAPPVAQ